LIKSALQFLGSKPQRPTRFIVLCHARSGSNVVSLGLDWNKVVKVFGEIFQASDEPARDGLPGRLSPAERWADPARFLEQEVFAPPPTGRFRALGFKMFYEHARDGEAQRAVWTYLIDHADIKVIHLVRRNLFDCKVSLEVALRSGEWLRNSGEKSSAAPVEPFSLSPWECGQYFGQITTSRLWAAEAFAHHPMLDLEYERDVCGDFAAAMARVFDFLGVPAVSVTPPLAKQQTRRPADQILNYDELRRTFRHTLYEDYFSDSVLA